MADKTEIDVLDEYIGQRIKIRRSMLRLSQDNLASIIGVTFQQIQKYESGVNRVSASRLFLISRALGVGVDFFFAGLATDSLPPVPGGVAGEAIKFDPMKDPETLKLVNAYWKIQNKEKRGVMLDFITGINDKG
jgi:transcriptional regulator with XRE-family HTH domain